VKAVSRKSQRLFAVFDIGTTGTRSVLVDEEGREIGKAYEEYRTAPRELGIHEQLTETYWRTASVTMQEALTKADSPSESVVAAIVTTTRDCVTPVNKDGSPIAPTVTWQDNRTSEKADELAEQIGPRRNIKRILWFQQERPSLFQKADKFIYLDAYINYRLCGAMVSDPANARFGPIDHETLKWSEELCEVTGIPVDKLAEIESPGVVIGEVTKDSSKATGLRKGTPVIMGSGDQQCSALGTGTIETGRVKATTGTGTFVITQTEDFIEDSSVMFSNPAAIPGRWILEGVIPGTGMAFRWYRDHFYDAMSTVAPQSEQSIYTIMESSAAKVPAGSDGLVVFPFMPYNKGIFYNLGFGHTKAHIARAIMEANGYGIRMYIEIMEGTLDLEFEEIVIDGGAANSGLWRQIQADCTNKSVAVPEVPDSTVIGAAILGTVGSGVYSTYEDAVSNMVRIEERRQPIPKHVEIYRDRYEIFNKLLIAELAEIVGESS
jgi:xylulokinase